MNTTLIVIAIVALVLNTLVVGFFLFAIWRAIMGKSSVDIKLATSVVQNGKKLDALTKSMSEHTASQNTLRGTIKDAITLIKNTLNEAKSK